MEVNLLHLSMRWFWELYGKYGKYQCKGNILYNKENILEDMNFACEFIDQNEDKYIAMGKRSKGSEIDRAVGAAIIVDGVGFWKDYIVYLCKYAIKYVGDVMFAPTNCKRGLI